MKRLGVVALAAVILQGVLGGLTVLFFLPDAGLDRARGPRRDLLLPDRRDRAVHVAAAGSQAADAVDDRDAARASRPATTALDLRADSRRRDDAAHRRRAGDSRLPADVRRLVPDHWDSADRHPLRASRRRARRGARRSLATPGTSGITTATGASFTRPALAARRARRRPDHAGRADGAQRAATSAINSAHVVCGALVLTTSLVLTLRTLARSVRRRSG